MPAESEEIAQMRLDYATDQRVWDLLDEVERLRAELRTTVAEQPEEIGQVRERIADRLFGQIHGQGITSPLLLADAVLDVLGLKQVAWLGPYGVVPGGLDNEPSPGWLPVYVLRPTQSGSKEGDRG